MPSTSMARSASAPLRARSRYSSVLESALVGLGREDAVVKSARKKRRKRRYEEPSLEQALSAPERRSMGDDEDPFASLKLLKSHKKRKKRHEGELGNASPAVTRSATKHRKHRRHAGVLELAGRTPMTRSMKKKWKRSSLEMVEDAGVQAQEDVVIQKKLFQSPERKKKIAKKEEKSSGKERRRVNRKAGVLKNWRVEWPLALETNAGDEPEKVQLVLTGQVDGEHKRFVVAKRESAVKFTAADGQFVALAGKLDRDAARSAGVPRAAMELMEDGVPAYWYKRLLPFVKKAHKTAKQETSKPKAGNKKASAAAKFSSPMPSIDDEADFGVEAAVVSTPAKDDDVFETPKPKKARAQALKKEKKNSARKDQPEPEAEEDLWTAEQLEALSDAKLKIPTTASNFWAQVAQFVPGKSAKDCQAKTFEKFRSPPTNRKTAKKAAKRANTEAASAIPSKIARAGSNKFKKQVREFVEEYEKKHVDDLFETTPSKEGLPELPEFDSIKSPVLATPSRSFDEDDSELDDEAPGLLKRLSSRRRDDIDSYVLGINRQHVAGGGVMAGGKVRRVTSMVTPSKPAKAKATSAKAVMLVEEVGSHSLKGVLSPGGTTHVRVEKDGSSSEEEDQDGFHSSDEEEDFDCLDER